MKTAVKKRYARWLSFTPSKGATGYGAAPHGDRLEGYPTSQTTPSGTASDTPSRGSIPVESSPSRDGSPCAKDAASRPENLTPFYPLMQILHPIGASI